MYLNLIELAESFGVPEKVVEDWIRDQGLPHTRDRGRLLFDRAQVTHWAAAHGLTARAGFLATVSHPFATGIALGPMLRSGGIWRDVPGTYDGVVEAMERILGSLRVLSAPVRQLLAQRLRAPGGINWAPVGDGLALPHYSTRVTLGRESGVVALLLLQTGFALPTAPIDDVPITRLFFFIPPSPRAHLDLLGRLSRAIQSDHLHDCVRRGASDESILESVDAFDRQSGEATSRGGGS